MTDKNVSHYLFTFAMIVGGIVESDQDELSARDRFNRELAQFYGAEAVEIREFRKATDSEIADYKAALVEAAAETPITETIN